MSVPYNFKLDDETARKFEELRQKNFRGKTDQLRYLVNQEHAKEFSDKPIESIEDEDCDGHPTQV